MSIKYIYLEETDSTSSHARRCIENAELTGPTLFRAAYQTGGRGRTGKSFFSPPDTGLYMSLVLTPKELTHSVVTLTTRAAVAAARVISRTFDIVPGIKWVNDIYYKDRKICGILCENMHAPKEGEGNYIIIGVGVNVFAGAFPDELSSIAADICSLSDGFAQKAQRLNAEERRSFLDRLAVSMAEELMSSLDADYDFISYYRERSTVIGKEITYTENGCSHEARAIGTDELGGLIIEENGAQRTLTSGEISVRTKK